MDEKKNIQNAIHRALAVKYSTNPETTELICILARALHFTKEQALNKLRIKNKRKRKILKKIKPSNSIYVNAVKGNNKQGTLKKLNVNEEAIKLIETTDIYEDVATNTIDYGNYM